MQLVINISGHLKQHQFHLNPFIILMPPITTVAWLDILLFARRMARYPVGLEILVDET